MYIVFEYINLFRRFVLSGAKNIIHTRKVDRFYLKGGGYF